MATSTTTKPRRLPGFKDSSCAKCGAQIVYARTVAGPNGPGGKWMPLNVVEDQAGNVAVWEPHRGQILCRVLAADEEHDRSGLEYRAMPHFATCSAATTEARTDPVLFDNVVPITKTKPKPRRGWSRP